MMTVILEPDVAPAGGKSRPAPSNTPPQLSRVFADLLPDEVRERRRLGRLQRRLAAAGCGLVVLLGLGYVLAAHGTSSAQHALDAEQARTSQLTTTLGTFTHLLQAQADAQAIRTQLAGVMVDDVQWSALIRTLEKTAPAGVRVGTLDATVPGPDDTAAAETNELTPNGDETVGTLSVSGTAPDFRHVAAYVSALSHVPGFTEVNPSNSAQGSTGGSGAGLTYTIQLSLTPHILGGRFTSSGAN